ncbi:hypothetical protein ACVRXQ_03615 [Streptococcus panodentis]|uniref:Uncharacterized protein n=1 Tax=Streptococcus panodentis TaxID=1581472 RepID=A0ABS5AZA3_9STRE|nr:hypothetical protein [Streptococcus panodentis]MBP2621845.1 hypothetical protein [Streptococcus panodentis]
MDFVMLFIILMLLLFALVGWVVYWAISSSARKNRRYEQFAAQHGYVFDQAQGNLYYREYSKNKTTDQQYLSLFENPYVKKYAAFTHYPFGRGGDIKVAYVLSGVYQGAAFRAFTYSFEGSFADRTGPGGIFSIVLLASPEREAADLPVNVFYEKGMLCDYLSENLDVDTIHDRLDDLIALNKGEE